MKDEVLNEFKKMIIHLDKKDREQLTKWAPTFRMDKNDVPSQFNDLWETCDHLKLYWADPYESSEKKLLAFNKLNLSPGIDSSKRKPNTSFADQ